jgi:hypothetical protein
MKTKLNKMVSFKAEEGKGNAHLMLGASPSKECTY